MSTPFTIRSIIPAGCVALLLIYPGCNQEEAAEKLSEMENSAEAAAETMADGSQKAFDEGKELAGELGEKAMAFLSPIKEKLGKLESLKETPEKLKVVVTELITSIEEKAEGIKLPESVSNTLASVKEQLIALQEYLKGEYEQAKIDEHVAKIVETVQSGLGMTDE